MPTPPISTTRPFWRTVIAAARTGIVSAEGGSKSSTQSIGPGAAACIRARSPSSSPCSRTVRTRERIVGSRSASLGAHRIHTVRGGGSSSAFSSTLEVRSVIRSASSMIMTR